MQFKLQNSKSVGAILADIKKGKDGPLVSSLLSSTLIRLCHLESGLWEGRMNPWREEKDGGETLLPLPDAASLGQLVSAEEWALLCGRHPSVLLSLVGKERLVLLSHQHIKLSVVSQCFYSMSLPAATESLKTRTKTQHGSQKNLFFTLILPLLFWSWQDVKQGLSFLLLLFSFLNFETIVSYWSCTLICWWN